MHFLIEFLLLGCIIYLGYTIFKLKEGKSNTDSLQRENEQLKNQFQFQLKETQLNADSLDKQNIDLKNQLTQTYKQFQERESYFKQTIDNLQSSFNKEAHIILSMDLRQQCFPFWSLLLIIIELKF